METRKKRIIKTNNKRKRRRTVSIALILLIGIGIYLMQGDEHKLKMNRNIEKSGAGIEGVFINNEFSAEMGEGLFSLLMAYQEQDEMVAWVVSKHMEVYSADWLTDNKREEIKGSVDFAGYGRSATEMLFEIRFPIVVQADGIIQLNQQGDGYQKKIAFTPLAESSAKLASYKDRDWNIDFFWWGDQTQYYFVDIRNKKESMQAKPFAITLYDQDGQAYQPHQVSRDGSLYMQSWLEEQRPVKAYINKLQYMMEDENFTQQISIGTKPGTKIEGLGIEVRAVELNSTENQVKLVLQTDTKGNETLYDYQLSINGEDSIEQMISHQEDQVLVQFVFPWDGDEDLELTFGPSYHYIVNKSWDLVW